MLVENVRWVESRVAFATLHVTGINDGLSPWTGDSAPTAAQAAEVEARIAATIDLVYETFDAAGTEDLQGVVLGVQADTFPTPASVQEAIIDRIASRATAFDRQVPMFAGRLPHVRRRPSAAVSQLQPRRRPR